MVRVKRDEAILADDALEENESMVTVAKSNNRKFYKRIYVPYTVL